MGTGGCWCPDPVPWGTDTTAPHHLSFLLKERFGCSLGIHFHSPRRQLKVWNTISGHLFGWFLNEAIQT